MEYRLLPVLLVPGFMLDERMWDAFVDCYPDQREFVRVNLNHGGTIAEMVEHIAPLLPERFIVTGFSLGGYLARAIVEAFPERCAGLILIATSLREDSPEQKARLDKASLAALAGDFNGFSVSSVKPSLHPSKQGDAVLIQSIRDMGKRIGPQVFRKLALLDRNNITTRQVRCPVMVVAAENDVLRHTDELNEIAEYFSCPVKTIKNCGHMIPMEKPAELAASISGWLKDNAL